MISQIFLHGCYFFITEKDNADGNYGQNITEYSRNTGNNIINDDICKNDGNLNQKKCQRGDKAFLTKVHGKKKNTYIGNRRKNTCESVNGNMVSK